MADETYVEVRLGDLERLIAAVEALTARVAALEQRIVAPVPFVPYAAPPAVPTPPVLPVLPMRPMRPITAFPGIPRPWSQVAPPLPPTPLMPATWQWPDDVEVSVTGTMTPGSAYQEIERIALAHSKAADIVRNLRANELLRDLPDGGEHEP